MKYLLTVLIIPTEQMSFIITEQAATQDSNCTREPKRLWHAGLKYNQT